MPEQFVHARLKIERANKHIADVKSLLSTLASSYVSTIELNPQPPYNEAIKHDICNRDKLVAELALLTGDAVHNLKCALDYAWIGIVERLIPSALGDFTNFPVRSTEDQLKAALKGLQINSCAPALFDRIVRDIRPYNGGNDSIWAIHRLDILDKHKLLIPVIEFVAITGIEVENESGEIKRNGFTWRTPKKAPFYIPIPPGWHVRNKGQLTTGVVFDERTPVQDMQVSDMLSAFAIQTINAVDLLEYL